MLKDLAEDQNILYQHFCVIYGTKLTRNKLELSATRPFKNPVNRKYQEVPSN